MVKVYSRGVVFFYPGFFFYSGKSFAKPAIVHRLSSFFFSLRKDTFGAPSALSVHSKSIRAFPATSVGDITAPSLVFLP